MMKLLCSNLHFLFLDDIKKETAHSFNSPIMIADYHIMESGRNNSKERPLVETPDSVKTQ